MKKPTALVDMDGTLADYNKALIRDLKKTLGPDEALPEFTHKTVGGLIAGTTTDLTDFDLDAMEQTPYLKARIDLIKRQPGWWLNLEPLKAGFEILEALKSTGFTPHVLTRGPKNLPAAWAEKLQWVRAKTDIKDVTITLDKSLVYGRVLVDDFPHYINGWLRHRPRGLVVMPDQTWNQDFPDHPQVLRYHEGDMYRDDKLLNALKAQRDR